MSVPTNWRVIESKSHPGKVYFYNVLSRSTCWDLPEEAGEVPSKIRARHILVKHEKVRNPFSKPKNQKVTLSRDDALVKITEILQKIQQGDNFEKLAKTESDCNSGKNGGDLGSFGHRQMQAEFETAAFALREHEISGVVESPSGFHIIQRLVLK